MALRLYNTLTRRKEDFVPIKDGEVGIYACGVTVYDTCHIGHARSAINFDVITRYLRYRGYRVTYVKNYTDVDDKIIAKANKEGVGFREIAERIIRQANARLLGAKIHDHIPEGHLRRRGLLCLEARRQLVARVVHPVPQDRGEVPRFHIRQQFFPMRLRKTMFLQKLLLVPIAETAPDYARPLREAEIVVEEDRPRLQRSNLSNGVDVFLRGGRVQRRAGVLCAIRSLSHPPTRRRCKGRYTCGVAQRIARMPQRHVDDVPAQPFRLHHGDYRFEVFRLLIPVPEEVRRQPDIAHARLSCEIEQFRAFGNDLGGQAAVKTPGALCGQYRRRLEECRSTRSGADRQKIAS